MARVKPTQEIVEARYPLYDADMKALIAKVYKAHGKSADYEERLIDVIWEEYGPAFGSLIIEASRGNPASLAAAERGELPSAGRAAILAYLNEARDFEGSLWDLSPPELAARHDEICGAAQERRQAERRDRGLQADEFAPFNRSSAKADFAHWGPQPHWSAEEATALSFGKDPRRVNVASLRAYKCIYGSPFRDDFMVQLDAIERALRSKQLREPLKPAHFLKWAANKGIEIHPDLIARVPKIRGSNNKPDIREVHTLYKIILGLVVKHYFYDPTPGNENNPKERIDKILKDLEYVWANTSESTLIKHLDLAKAWANSTSQPLVQRVRKDKLIQASASPSRS